MSDEDFRERIRRIIKEDREILDALAGKESEEEGK